MQNFYNERRYFVKLAHKTENSSFRFGRGGVPLLDGITVRHGPTRDLARFFLLADAAARDVGVTLRLHGTLHGMIEANEAFGENWAPLVPTLDPRVSNLTPETSFWISGHDAQGRLVATQAARLLDLSGSHLDEELRSMRLLYADPAPTLSKGARITVEGDAAIAAARIGGRTTYSGGGWNHPDFRRRGLSSILPRISRSLALTRWDTAFTVSLVEPILTTKGVPGRYGYSSVETGIALTNTYRGDLELHLMWMDRNYLTQDMHDYISKRVENDPRKDDAEPTNATSPSRQGSISLS